MFSDELKRLYRLRAIKNGAMLSSWMGILAACVLWYCHGQGWLAEGIRDWQAAGCGYLLGAFIGAGASMSAYNHEGFEKRLRGLEWLDERVDDDEEFLERELKRMKREALLWNPVAWPFALAWGILTALRPIPEPRPSAD